MRAGAAGVGSERRKDLFVGAGVVVVDNPVNKTVESVTGDRGRGDLQVLGREGIADIRLPIDVKARRQRGKNLLVPGLGDSCLWQIEAGVLRHDAVE